MKKNTFYVEITKKLTLYGCKIGFETKNETNTFACRMEIFASYHVTMCNNLTKKCP